jgi:large subunit ribosomal protein L6
MSRIGNFPVELPANVEIQLSNSEISVKGPLGTLKQSLSAQVTVEKIENRLQVKVANNSTNANAMSGTVRALVANMVHGVTKGYEKKLSLVGVGYRAAAAGAKLNLQIGFSHPVAKDMPEGVTVACPTQTEIVIKGSDRQVVGQIAAEVRAIRPPEPYKGKGIRYAGEYVQRKVGKRA